MKEKFYLRIPLIGNDYKVCNEQTDEVIAIFFNQKDAIDYINQKKMVNYTV